MSPLGYPRRAVLAIACWDLPAWGLAWGLVSVLGCAGGAGYARRAAPPRATVVHPEFDADAAASGASGVVPPGPLAVRDVRPEGPSDGLGIRLRLDRAVVDPAAAHGDAALVLERIDTAGARHPVSARSRWLRPDSLALVPDQELPAATAFEVRLVGRIVDDAGGRVEGTTWRFETQRPLLERHETWEELHGSTPIWIVPSSAVDPRRFAAHLRVRAVASRHDHPVDVRRSTKAENHDLSLPEDALAIVPKSAWPDGATLDIMVDADLVGDDGPLAMGTPWRTQLDVRRAFEIGAPRCEAMDDGACPLGPVTIETSTSIDEETLDRIRVEPSLPGMEVHLAHTEPPGITIDGEWRSDQRYRVVFDRRLVDEHGRKLGRTKRVAVRLREELAPDDAMIELSSTFGIFTSPKAAKIAVRARRVTALDVRIATVRATDMPALVGPRELAKLGWPETDRDVRSHHVLPAGSRWNESVTIDVGKGAALGDVVIVEATATDLAPRSAPPQSMTVRGVYRLSALGVVAHRGPRHGFVRVTSVDDGVPVEGASVELLATDRPRARRTTDRHGLAHIDGAGDESAPPLVLVTRGDDAIAMRLAIQPALREDDRRAGKITPSGKLAVHPRSGSKRKRSGPLRTGELASIEIYTGRSVYQAEDPVHVAGWASISTPHGTSATHRVPPGTKVTLELHRERSSITTSTVRIDEHGRFHGTLRIPSAAPLGNWHVTATLLGATTTGRFVVAETRIPTFEVELDAGPGEILRGTEIAATASARYLSGEAATIGAVSSTMSCNPTSPPGMHELELEYSAATETSPDVQFFGSKPTLKHATASWRFPTANLDPRTGWSCSIAVAVADQGLQEVGADDWVYVRAANVHLALRQARPIAGRRHTIEAMAVDRRGRRVALDDVEIRLDRGDDDSGREATCRVDIAAEGPAARCRTAKLREGEHRIGARATADERLVHIEQTLWVDAPPKRTVESPPAIVTAAPPPEPPFEIRVADVLPAGERAKVVISAPWATGSGVLAIEQIGLRETIPFVLVDGRATVHVTPVANLGPTIELVARVARGTGEGALPTEHVAQASATVLRDRQLRVHITTPGRAAIGERVPIRIDVHDQGLPVDARVALWVVDVGLDELRPTQPPSMADLDRDRRQERGVARTYDALLDPFPGLTGHFWGRKARVPRVRMASAEVKGALDEPSLRKRFDAAPLFVGNVGTGADGFVTVDLPLPDDLTRFRITAVASAPLADDPKSGPARFGHDKGFITTTTPLVVRAALPRTLRPGDETTIAALVSMPRDGDVDVVLELPDDAVRSVGPVRKRVRGHRGSVARVTFTVKAHAIGEPRLRLRATLHASGRKPTLSGAVEQRALIRHDRTQTERVALYGSVDDEQVHALPVRLPRSAQPASGTVEVATTSSLLGDFTDAATYLEDYPYGCIEQSASRLVPLVALEGLGARTREAAHARASATKSIAYILSMQLADGSFAYWPGTSTSAGFAGGYALWILQLAERRGFDVPADALARGRAALAKHVRTEDPTTDPVTPESIDHWLTHVMILHVLADAGEARATDFDIAHAHRDRISTAGRALLAMAMHRAAPTDPRLAELRRGLGALVEERPAVAHFIQPDGATRAAWDSPARDDAIGLMAVMQLDPKDPLADKLAAGLVARRERGRWRTTQENAFALLALADYATRREAEIPNHRVRVWIGDRRVLAARVTTRDDVRRGGSVPLDAVRDDKGTTAIVLAKNGTGRVHWRVGVQWTEADPPARAQGLTLATRILDEHDEVVTRMIVGRRYRVEMQLSTDTPQQHIAVEVPLPGGVDAIDRSLGHGVAARIASAVDSFALSHVELRADRATLFFDDLEPGTTIQQIAVLATAAGTYAVPGAVAEAMYEPETFARTRAARIEIAPQTP